MEDSFIGQTFNDGKLTVIGWDGERLGNNKFYKVQCSECAKDLELFVNKIFKATKQQLSNGTLPCGCSPRPRWSSQQYRILISRKASGRYSVVVPDGAKVKTKVQCHCNICDHSWESSISSLLNTGTGCPNCDDRTRGEAKAIPENEAVDAAQKIADEKNWTFNGFKDGWKGVNKSRLLLKCHCNREWAPWYTSVVYSGNGCSACAKTGYSPSKSGSFYCYLWEHKETGEQFLKYGISNVPVKRIRNQRKSNSKYTATKLYSIDFTDGQVAQDLERQIDIHKKTNNILSPALKELFPDGWTETLPVNELGFVADLVQRETMCRIAST